jgi:hypothetical protein
VPDVETLLIQMMNGAMPLSAASKLLSFNTSATLEAELQFLI